MSHDFALPASGWTPYKYQLKAWNAMVQPQFRRGYLCWPRRHGKDSVALHVTAVKAMSKVGNYAIMLPQVNQVRRALWEGLTDNGIQRYKEAFPDQIVTRVDNQAMMLWLISGSTVQFLGSDQYESSIGSGFRGIVHSESALSDPRAAQFLRPMLEANGGYEIHISTPRGKNHFYRGLNGAAEDLKAGDNTVFAEHLNSRQTGLFNEMQLNRIRMDYIRDMGATQGNATFEQEYMCSFEAAIVGSVWGAELEELYMEDRVRPCPHDRRFPVHTSWDIGVADATVILFWQEINGQYRLIDGYEATGIGLGAYVQVLRDRRQTYGYNYSQHFGPHDIQQREWVRGLSRMDEAKRLGLEFKRTPQTRIKTQIAAGSQLLRQMVINADSPGAMQAYEHFKGYRFPIAKGTGELVETPLHDEHSHASSALMTMAVNVASKLGVSLALRDPDLHSRYDDALGGQGKWDPRQFGSAPFSHENSVSNMMRSRGAFG